MKFKVTKYYYKGQKNKKEKSYILNFPSLEAAERWKEETNNNHVLDFVILDVVPKLM